MTVPDNRLLCCARVGIGYVSRPEGLDPVHLDKDGKATYALDAAGVRLWHAYVHLGYDLEPDCEQEDYE